MRSLGLIAALVVLAIGIGYGLGAVLAFGVIQVILITFAVLLVLGLLLGRRLLSG